MRSKGFFELSLDLARLFAPIEAAVLLLATASVKIVKILHLLMWPLTFCQYNVTIIIIKKIQGDVL
jgi:hypothetical protein